MNNLGFNGLNTDNPLYKLMQPYLSQNQQPTDPAQQSINSQISGYSGAKVYEILKSDDLTYIKPDNTGQKQYISCEPEKIIYVARYNYATEKPDYEKYISEGTIDLFKKPDTSAEMSQIAEALMAVVNKLESMDTKIQELKTAEPKKEESNRKPNGQFKKKGEA